MIHKDPALLRSLSTAGPCDWCGRYCRRRDVHHVQARGMGGAQRLDIMINLLQVGASLPFPECPCHGEMTANRIPKCDQWAKIAAREGTMQHHIETVIKWLNRLDKHASPERIERGLSIMAPGPATLARRVIAEIQESKSCKS